jgi:hypothetical protein
MALTVLSEDEYTTELNRQLKEHAGYTPGIEFLAYPKGPIGSSVLGTAYVGLTYNPADIDLNVRSLQSLSCRRRNEFRNRPTLPSRSHANIKPGRWEIYVCYALS